MLNILLDKMPTEYEGYPIDSDFQIGIQIMQILEDEELTEQERVITALLLLFPQEDKNGNPLQLPDAATATSGIIWFLTGWDHDNREKGNSTKVTDYDIDQWRIYSAFRQHYGINLNNLGKRCIGYKLCDGKILPEYEDVKLHFWEFMGLLTTLPECAYTKVVDIRAKEINSKMPKEERDIYKKLKKLYSLKQNKEIDYTEDQKKAIDEFDRMMEEQKKIRKRKRLAAQAFESLAK